MSELKAEKLRAVVDKEGHVRCAVCGHRLCDVSTYLPEGTELKDVKQLSPIIVFISIKCKGKKDGRYCNTINYMMI